MSSATQQNLVEKNAEFAANFTEEQGKLPIPPARQCAVVTCMDSRIDAMDAFGLQLGDAHVIRNAGGSARDALRSLLISQQFLGTREILVIKHTGCGMVTFDNEKARKLVVERLGPSAVAEIGTMDFLPFTDLDQAVRDDLAFLRKTNTIPDDVVISGWVYEVENGKVRRVE